MEHIAAQREMITVNGWLPPPLRIPNLGRHFKVFKKKIQISKLLQVFGRNIKL